MEVLSPQNGSHPTLSQCPPPPAPILQLLASKGHGADTRPDGPLALVLLPTRELAQQVGAQQPFPCATTCFTPLHPGACRALASGAPNVLERSHAFASLSGRSSIPYCTLESVLNPALHPLSTGGHHVP